MQHELSRRATTDQHAQFLNERVTSTTRFHRRVDKIHPDDIEQLDYGRESNCFRHHHEYGLTRIVCSS